MSLTVGSLFSGIGGLDLGLERAGMKVKWQVENDPYCQKVLKKHWPDVTLYGDIKELDFSECEPVDLICGGFPCQPVSLAGRRKGQEDERWLWPECARALRTLRPTWALLENVPGLMSKGFGDVASDLASCGYDFEWDRIPAAAVGAPHLRFRVIVVAHSRSARRWEDTRGAHGDESQDARRGTENDHQLDRDGQGRGAGAVAAADPIGRYGRTGVFGPAGWTQPEDSGHGLANANSVLQGHGHDGTEETFRNQAQGAEGIGHPIPHSGHWDVEPCVGRVANGVPKRMDRLRALGNAVVPQVFEVVGRRILAVA